MVMLIFTSRLTVDGKRAELSIRRKINVTKWNSSAGKAKGFTKESQELNHYIDIIRNKIQLCFTNLIAVRHIRFS
jgi:Arm domain-containing DNA-binding protein